MYAIPPEQVAAAVAEVIMHNLMQGETVQVPGLGTFAVEHYPSQAIETEQGEVVLQPPRNILRFVAD